MERRAAKFEGTTSTSTDAFQRELRSIWKGIDLSACSSNGFTPVPADIGNNDSLGNNVFDTNNVDGKSACENNRSCENSARVLRTVDNTRATQQLTPARFLPESSFSSYGCDYTRNAGFTPIRDNAAGTSARDASALEAARLAPAGMHQDVSQIMDNSADLYM